MTTVHVHNYELHVMEIPVDFGSAYVQRVGSQLCFYEGEVSDTDVARDTGLAAYRVPVRTFARIVAALREPGDGAEHGGYRYSLGNGGQVIWTADCGDHRRVEMPVLEAILERFGD